MLNGENPLNQSIKDFLKKLLTRSYKIIKYISNRQRKINMKFFCHFLSWHKKKPKKSRQPNPISPQGLSRTGPSSILPSTSKEFQYFIQLPFLHFFTILNLY
jgi:hypothetical protein